MALALADRYSSLSFKDCLSSISKRGEEAREDPLVDLPLTDNHQRTFAVPPGIEVRFQIEHTTDEITACAIAASGVPETILNRQ